MKRTNKKGFTLVELVVVIAVLLILAAIAIPTVSGIIDKANRATDEANAKSIETAIKYAITQNEISKNDATYTAVSDIKGALQLSGSSTSILTCKRNGYSFYYDNANGSVVSASTKPDSAVNGGVVVQLTEDDTIDTTTGAVAENN